MAGGVSKRYESNWTYQPGGDRFEDRVGKILSKGMDLQKTFKDQALQTAKKAVAFENEMKANSGTYNPANADPSFYQQTVSSKPPPADTRGVVWVSPQGEFLSTAPDPQAVNGSQTEQLTNTQQQGLTSTQRSMHLWRKVNPGCIETTTVSPISSHTEHYAHRPEQIEPVNKEFYRKKTDFSLYCEAGARQSNAAKPH